MKHLSIYGALQHPVLRELAETPPMQRLKQVGMNCGCEYTAFPRFAGLEPYSRYAHSVGAAAITYRFTENPAAAAAALLHDIATPVFAHTVDFLNGDYETQESTEADTERLIAGSSELCSVLGKYGLTVEQVSDYHQYPIADNDTPRLSADRLEYTLGNSVNYQICEPAAAKQWYDDLLVTENEEGMPELAFRTREQAEQFALSALACSKIYVAPEDRYAMQRLSELLKHALKRGCFVRKDLYRTEPELIRLLQAEPETAREWATFRGLTRMVAPETASEAARVIPAKKRHINPLVAGEGRISDLCPEFRTALEEFLCWDFTVPIAGI